jgi:IclR family transcriptional regulator, KDG regulon repressor
MLELLAGDLRPHGVSEIARALAIDRATTHRLLRVLVANEFVQQDSVTRQYRCTTRLVELSGELLAQLDLPQRAQPYIHELVQQTGQSAHLAVLARRSLRWAVYVADEKSASHVQVDVRVGEMSPTHCTAVGKALIAYQPDTALRKLTARGRLESYTVNTVTHIETLLNHLAQVRRRGYAVDDEEFHLNIRCVGAPVRGNDGQVVASLGISGIATDLPKSSITEFANAVIGQADGLSHAIGFPGERSRVALASSHR